jgi:hypothetical protein
VRLAAALPVDIGNNDNNRSEEAVGSAKDIWTAFWKGRFGQSPSPFLGYLFLLEDRDNVKHPSQTKNRTSKLIRSSEGRIIVQARTL